MVGPTRKLMNVGCVHCIGLKCIKARSGGKLPLLKRVQLRCRHRLWGKAHMGLCGQLAAHCAAQLRLHCVHQHSGALTLMKGPQLHSLLTTAP